jgi:hypothetical protein
VANLCSTVEIAKIVLETKQLSFSILLMLIQKLLKESLPVEEHQALSVNHRSGVGRVGKILRTSLLFSDTSRKLIRSALEEQLLVAGEQLKS